MTLPHFTHYCYPASVAIFSGFLLIGQHGFAASDPHTPCARGEGTGPHANLVVYERIGLEGIAFGFGKADVEKVLGPAEGGSEHHLSYESSGIKICFCGERIKDFHFQIGFRGKLHRSGLGIGSDLDAVIAAYGEIKEEKVVDSVCGWKLDRVLLVRANQAATDEPAYKLFYYDIGMFFIFDDDALLTEFGVYKCHSD